MAENCLISSFYIKPQLVYNQILSCHIVLYRLSTSNHNRARVLCLPEYIVLYRLSTSNHNLRRFRLGVLLIVLYRLSTSNHNHADTHNLLIKLSYIVFLHQTTTLANWIAPTSQLSYIVFLHQTTTISNQFTMRLNCLISSFYIKPQQYIGHNYTGSYCLISSFYIKPQLLRYIIVEW